MRPADVAEVWPTRNNLGSRGETLELSILGGRLNGPHLRSLPARRAGRLGSARCDARRSDFLNNRYYDPTIGVFLSVDPLVAKTGTPYLYAAGNPTTLSDPNGLCAVTQGMHSYDDGVCRGFG